MLQCKQLAEHEDAFPSFYVIHFSNVTNYIQLFKNNTQYGWAVFML
jgi:hypothetical protein